MPELPEVETVRVGLADHVLHRPIRGVEVASQRAVRRQDPGVPGLTEALPGSLFSAAVRRGKFLWLPLERGGEPTGTALVAHLGMSGQLLVRDTPRGAPHHLRARLTFGDGGELDFVDQRTFGHLSHALLVPTADGRAGGYGSPAPVVPLPVEHIARDLLDPAVELDALARAVRTRRSTLKRVLLDQQVVAGIGNIYADEALWRARTHPEHPTQALSTWRARSVLAAAAEVMREALHQGGTSFDALYVNVNGASGYFDRSLEVYGRTGEPCRRCATPIRRDPFMNRSSYFCPRCQRKH